MNLDALSFADPQLVHGLWVWLAFVGVLVLLERRGSDSLNRLVGRALEAKLIERPAAWRRRLRLGMQAFAGLFMILALMRPQWGERFVATPRVGAEIMIALDVSRSMLADDAKPSRLERAKAEIADLLAYLEDDQVGLIAFAGRASVLSPMTPDKSFLRLALDGAGPHSVSRGGTRLAEPIQRAIAGLGEPGPAQRALLLITDGEDQDSFALDAAKKAAAAGIKIITIGFGDEAGSQIYVVDPDDGSRTLVRDGEGNPVVSRLDGDLLREIALATDGAYVPAGTGVLDLASIYDTHIARLTRGQLDSRGRSVRGEIYQIFVAGALVCLVVGASATAGRWRRDAALARTIALAIAALVLSVASPIRAVDTDTPSASAPPIGEPLEPAEHEAAPVEEDPRTRFNRANAALAEGDAALASTLYREARRDAVDDVDLRYAASFNLGMAAVAQADAVEASKPAESLAHLHEATDWFREASAMQPDETDPRHNLDVVLRRALILADAIARKGKRDVEGELDQLIEQQRGRAGETAMLLEAVVRAGELEAADSLRPAFDAAATAQREVLADGEGLAERVANERAALDAKPQAERTPEEALRSASLEGVLAYLDQAVERMGQTRRQLRLRSGERAYRRASESLDLLKRARDPLRDPVEQLAVLRAEVAGVARGTAALGNAQGADAGSAADRKLGSDSKNEAARLPAFLTPEAMLRETAAIAARVGELAVRFASAAAGAKDAAESGGAASASSGPAGADPDGAATATPEISQALVAALAGAAPRVQEAHGAMERATAALGEAGFADALAADGEAALALEEAQELFFDLRQLLAVTHETEAGIAAIAVSADPEIVARRASVAADWAKAQTRNQKRADRLEALLASERIAARAASSSPDPAADPNAAPPTASDPAQLEAIDARFDRADGLLAEAATAMAEATRALPDASSARTADWPAVGQAAVRAADRLDALRKLFLSLIELLQRLEREQVDLADETHKAIALAAAETERGAETKARIGAVAAEQRALEGQAGAIADALVAQSEQAPPRGTEANGNDQGGSPSGSPSAPDRDTLRRAADHVATAQLAMQDSIETFDDVQRPLPPASEAQRVARDELRKAIALLAPPPPENQPEPPKNDPSQDEGQSGEDPESESSEDPGSESNDGAQPEPGEGADPADEAAGEDEAGAASEDQAEQAREAQDPAQLLQGVRDREAERRDAGERKARSQRRSVPVEKDW